jgi:hypothetical protein
VTLGIAPVTAEDGPALVARSGRRIVGSVRTRVVDGVLHVGRLVVDGDDDEP